MHILRVICFVGVLGEAEVSSLGHPSDVGLHLGNACYFCFFIFIHFHVSPFPLFLLLYYLFCLTQNEMGDYTK